VLIPLIQQQLRAVENSGLEEKRAVGESLIEAKTSGQIALGSWGAWINRHFHLSVRTAQEYMQLARKIADSELRGVRAPRTIAEATGRTARDNARRPLREALGGVDVEAVAQETQTRTHEVKLHRDLALELIDIGYKALATRLHPDRGGSRGAMTRLNRVRDELREVAANRRYV
jgi:hypothetical protein